MTIEANLDFILRFLANGSGYIQYTGTDYRSILSQLKITDIDLLEYLEILRDDDYVKLSIAKDNFNNDIIGNVRIKIKGKFFINKGGYLGEIKNKKKEKFIDILRGLLSGILGAIVGAILTMLPIFLQKPTAINLSCPQKIQIVHDTIYLYTRTNK